MRSLAHSGRGTAFVIGTAALTALAVTAPAGTAPANPTRPTSPRIAAATATPVLGAYELFDAETPGVYEEARWPVALSADGRYVAMHWDTDDIGTWGRIGLWDRQTDTVAPIAADTGGGWSDSWVEFTDLSPDGAYAVFDTNAHDVVDSDTNHHRDVYLRNMVTGENARVSLRADGSQFEHDSYGSGVTPDGRFVLYETETRDYSYNDPTRLYVHDMRTGRNTVASTTAHGEHADNACYPGDISADGRYVAYSSTATNLKPDGDRRRSDVFVKDRRTGDLQLVSRGPFMTSDTDARFGGMTSDGRLLLFGVRTKGQDFTRYFIRDLREHTTSRVTIAARPGRGNVVDDLQLLGVHGEWAFVETDVDLTGEESQRGAARDLDGYVVRLASGEAYRVTGPPVGADPPPVEYDPSQLAFARISSRRTVVALVTTDALVPEDTDEVRDIYTRTITW
jgi:Tol biopolymer transport system component